MPDFGHLYAKRPDVRKGAVVNHSENSYWYRAFPRPIDGKRVHYRLRFGSEVLEGIGIFQVQQMKEHQSISILRTDAAGSPGDPLFRLLEAHLALIAPHPNSDIADFLFLETPPAKHDGRLQATPKPGASV